MRATEVLAFLATAVVPTCARNPTGGHWERCDGHGVMTVADHCSNWVMYTTRTKYANANCTGAVEFLHQANRYWYVKQQYHPWIVQIDPLEPGGDVYTPKNEEGLKYLREATGACGVEWLWELDRPTEAPVACAALVQGFSEHCRTHYIRAGLDESRTQLSTSYGDGEQFCERKSVIENMDLGSIWLTKTADADARICRDSREGAIWGVYTKQCERKTAGTCRIFGCDKRRGATSCINGQCMCADDFCSKDGGRCAYRVAGLSTEEAVSISAAEKAAASPWYPLTGDRWIFAPVLAFFATSFLAIAIAANCMEYFRPARALPTDQKRVPLLHVQ